MLAPLLQLAHFAGNSVGTFLSKVVPNSINEKSTFEINPFISSGSTNEKLNIRFTEDPSVTFIGDPINEYYSLTVYPSDKNITLLDPGERILVNDGSGFVTTGEFGFSGNTIIFKYNSNPLDSSVEFNFYAYDIEGIDFNHHITNLAISDANFNGLIEIIDYDIDSDNDGIPDKLDLDSDGDGCPDVEEADVNFNNATGIRPRIFRDPDKNDEYGDQSTTPPFKLEYLAVGGTLDSRGRIIDLINSTSGTYDNPPLDPITGIPVYLEINAPSVVFSAGGQPEDYQICEIGQDAEFKVTVDSGGYTPFYQWQVDIQDGNGWKNLLDSATTPLTIDANLEIKSVTAAMNGWEYRVLTWSDGAFCYSVSNSAVLKVEATLPTAKAVDLANPLFDENWIIKCDDDYDGKATFDLTLIDDYIRGPLQSSTDFEVSYFLNATDAASPTTTGITSPSTYTNTPNASYDPNNPSTQTLELHVRVRNINSNCIADPMSFELTINTVPLLFSLPDVEQCNDTVFDLEDLQDDISSNYTNEVFEFFDSTGTLIASPSNYQLPDLTISNEELITVVVKNNPSLGSPCDQTITFTLRAGACDIPSTFPVLDEAVCETSTDPLGGGQDGFETFDKSIFTNIEADLITAEPLFGIFGTEINFFRSDADATAGVSTTAIDKTLDYTTSAGQGFTFNATENRWEQELWVRVENTTLGTACFDTQQVATLYINKLPELLTATVDVNQCDVGIFNLTDQEDNLSLNYADEVFEYYDSTGALITDPTNYEIPSSVNLGLTEAITVTVSTTPSIGTACINTTASINLAWSVTTLPAGYNLIDEYLIETDPDPKGQGQDGIETFDKSIFATVQADLIRAERAFVGKTFSFYRSQNDALTSSDKIDTTVDFTTDKQTNAGFTFNTAENRWEQQIWVYIEDSVTTAIATCYGLYQIATVYVEKRPVFYDVTTQEFCDAETPLDMYSLFDTSLLFSEFTTDPTGSVAQNTSLFTVEYTYVDDTGATKTLDPTLPLSFNSGDQTITVTLTNNSTNSALVSGVSSGTIEFKVYQQPVAYPSDPSVAGVYTFEECDDDNDGLAVGEEVFDMSTIKTLLLTDLSGTYPAQDPGDFDFEFSVAGSPITLGSDYTATTGDQIEVTITNPLFTSCEETITIDFVVNPLPSFDIDDPTVICLNLTQPVEIGTSNWNGAADPSIYTYSWTLDSDPSFSETTETIFPVKGGIYTVVAEDPITFCTQTKSITVTESEIASIDLDKDGDVTDSEYEHFIEVLDLTDDNTNTITINNVTDLGIGDYEFSLDDSFGPYQDDPIFTDVPPGVHTVYIRDKNSYYTYDYGCGIAEIKVSIIGYKKYFTPNGDGINEKWKILGINFDFNKDSKVYIFDRYGKLLKQLDPLSEGWDGTYIGKPMPATDYWFRVYLEDGREFKGHFSLVRGN